MRKIRESVQLVVLLAGAGGLISLACSSGDSTPAPGGGGSNNGGKGGGISLGGNKDGGATGGAGGGMAGQGGAPATGGSGPGGAPGTGGSGPGGSGGSGQGGSGGAAPPIGNSVALQDFPAAFAGVFCDKIYSCCTPAELMSLPPTSAECRSRLTGLLQPLVADLQPSITAGRVVYHGDKMAACLKATQAQSCADARTGMSAAGAMTDCDGAFEPKVALGGVCLDSAECIGGFCGTNDPNATMGMCVARVANGSPCQGDSMCMSDNCDATTMVCAPPAPSGGLCGM